MYKNHSQDKLHWCRTTWWGALLAPDFTKLKYERCSQRQIKGRTIWWWQLYQRLTSHLTLWQTGPARSGSKVVLRGAISPLQADKPSLQGGDAFTQLPLCLPGPPHPLTQVLL